MSTRHGLPPLPAVAFVAFLTLTGAAHASPGARSGFGSRSQALAGAEVGDARGAPAVFENPAALVQTPDTELSLGTSFTSFDLALDEKDAGLPSVRTLDFGVVVPGAVLTLPIAFGLDFSLPNGRFSKLHNADPTVAYYPLDDSGPRLLDLGVALAIRPLPNLALGGGVGFLAAAQGGFRAQGSAVPADGSGAEYDSNLHHSVDADLVSVRYPIFGATLTPSRELVVGVSFRGSATIEQRVAGELEGTVRLGTADIPVSYAFETRASLAFLPSVLSIGGTLTSLPAWRLSAQIDWEDWSAYPAPYALPKTHLEIDLPPGVMIPMPAPAPLPPPVVFGDRYVPRVGVERTFELDRSLDLFARAGYAFESAVAPATQSGTLLLDLDRHVFALGAGALFRRPFGPFGEIRLDAHGSLTEGVSRSVVAGPPGNPTEHRVSGRLLQAGLTLDLAFDAY